MPEARMSLEGVRIADFSWYGAGPIAGQILAMHGAEVIRVESEVRPDGLRSAPPLALNKTGLNISGYYNNFNTNKLSLTLNMGHPKARDIALRLIAKCDVAFENYTPATFEKWGLTYEAMRAVKPDIIFVRVPMQGTWGPHRDFAGFGALNTPVAGLSSITGFPHRPPVGIGTNYSDYVVNPGHVAIAILSALHYRNRTGKGQFIEVAQVESTMCVIGTALLEYTVNGRVHERTGNRIPHAAPHSAYPCRGEDRWVAIAVFTDAEWRALCEVMGNPEWCREERFATLLGRKQHEDELDQMIEAWTSEHEAEWVMETLQAAGVPAGVVQSAEDVLDNDPHLKARGYYAYLDHPEAGRTAYDGVVARLSKTPGRAYRPAPCIGEHNEYVLREIIGMEEDEMADLTVEGVIR